MSDPYSILDLPLDSTDETIRRRYLTLVRTHTPEREPERFAAIREAYDKLRDPISRLQYRLFEAGKDDTLEAILEDAKARISPCRVAVTTLRSWGQKRL